MKTGSGVNLIFLSNFSQLLLSNISLFTVFFTADVGFCCCCYLAFRLGICFQVDVDIITPPPPIPPPAPSRPDVFFALTRNSFFNAGDTELFEISARLKLVSVPFSGLLLDFFFLYLAQQPPALHPSLCPLSNWR